MDLENHFGRVQQRSVRGAMAYRAFDGGQVLLGKAVREQQMHDDPREPRDRLATHGCRREPG
jgi:hypothetical protein